MRIAMDTIAHHNFKPVATLRSIIDLAVYLGICSLA
jgi:hypothetical protein